MRLGVPLHWAAFRITSLARNTEPIRILQHVGWDIRIEHAKLLAVVDNGCAAQR